MNILIADGYLGGSHKLWAEGLKRNSKFHIDIYGLSAKYWKWRMQSAAISICKQIEENKPEIDLFICTDMINVSLFKSLLPKAYRDKPCVMYMHENQISYPWSPEDPEKKKDRDFSYGFINYTSALAADHLCFNSEYHLNSFLLGAKSLLKMMPDNRHYENLDQIAQKSTVQYVGINYQEVLKHKIDPVKKGDPILLWNHRWEYDKNPDLFFKSLFRLKDEKVPFSLMVIGRDYERKPKIFDQAKEVLKDHIIQFGYLENITDYYKCLWMADIIPVSCNQDFFGISVVEAIAANCMPLLPKRLSYPEHLSPLDFPNCFYNEDDFYDSLKNMLINKTYLNKEYGALMEKYDWKKLVNTYDDLFERLLK